jgi:hypothetical protein
VEILVGESFAYLKWPKKALFMLGVVSLANVCLASPRWKVEIVAPDREVKEYLLDDSETKLKLPKSKWICQVTKTNVSQDEETQFYRKDINCTSDWKAEIFVPVVCTNKTPRSIAVQLNGGGFYVVTLRCEN